MVSDLVVVVKVTVLVFLLGMMLTQLGECAHARISLYGESSIHQKVLVSPMSVGVALPAWQRGDASAAAGVS